MEGVSSELWVRLRRLDRTCTFTLCRVWVDAGRQNGWAPRIYEKRWRVSVERRGLSPVVTESAYFNDALGSAIDEAERRGWHLSIER